MTSGIQFYSSIYTPLFFFKWPEALSYIPMCTHLYSSLNDQRHSILFQYIHTFILLLMTRGTQFYSSICIPLFFFKWPEALNFVSKYAHLNFFLNDQTQFFSCEYTLLFFFKWPDALNFISRYTHLYFFLND